MNLGTHWGPNLYFIQCAAVDTTAPPKKILSFVFCRHREAFLYCAHIADPYPLV